MPVAADVGAFTAFERLLNSLCLDEFPCGSGSWRTSEGNNVDPATQFTTTTRNYGAGKEQVESLEELVTSSFSPYAVDYSWSSEARGLREMAVKRPWLISKEFILEHFQSLRIVDKNVTQVDPAMLQFPALKELTLSANLLSTVESKHLPRSLTILELVANEISDLKQLCSDPPSLQHLGLSYNRISDVHDYLTGDRWPCLLSLDLSFNNLTELKGLVQTLQTLPKLRNLALVGNPLALTPGYRGYVIDSLRDLLILDDTQISADEKHHFKGLARRGDFIRNEAQVVIKIQSITGIPKPPEVDATEEAPQFPIINRYYYVEFLFLEESGSGEGSLTDRTADVNDKIGDQNCKKADQDSAIPTMDGEMVTKAESAVNGHSEPLSTSLDPQALNGVSTGKNTKEGSTTEELRMKSYRTQGVQWSEETSGDLDIGFTQGLIIDDLPALKQCLKGGFKLAVKEDKVLSNPPEECDGSVSQASHKKPAKADKKEEKKPEKGGKKKKKEPEIELVQSPPVVTTLGTYTLDLEALVSGEHVRQEVCTCHVIERTSAEEEQLDNSDDKKEKKKKGGSEAEVSKNKKGKEVKDKDKKNAKSARLERSPSSNKPSPAKGASEDPSMEEEPPSTPPPLTICVMVELVKWNTAQDSIPKEETQAT